MECKYKTGELSGLECPCEKCGKIRAMLAGKEKVGEIKVIKP